MTDEEFAEQVTGVSALADPVRRALYRFIAEADAPVSRDQAAAGVGLARHTAKFHLDRLVDDGLLDTEFRRLSGRRGPGAGRPAKLYRRSARQFEVSLPGRSYDVAGRILAGGIDTASDGAPLVDAVRQAAVEEGRRLARERGSGPLVEVLAGLGYEPRDDGECVVLNNCPFHALAERHTALVCGMNLDMLAAVVDERAEEQLRPVLDPAPGRCCVVLRPVDRTPMSPAG
jgi:predicted ArsR family transcriptional regulator